MLLPGLAKVQVGTKKNVMGVKTPRVYVGSYTPVPATALLHHLPASVDESLRHFQGI